MKTIIVSNKYNGKRIDRFLFDTYKNVPSSAFYKAFRQKDIKVNGKRVQQNFTLTEGDSIDIYIKDEILDNTLLIPDEKIEEFLDIIYEDQNIVVINKKQGIPVHSDSNDEKYVLLNLVQDYYKDKNIINNNFKPELCHRLDRNTGGIVIFAKNKEALDILLDKFKNHEIKKYYICLVYGLPEKKEAVLKGYLKKDSSKSVVKIYSKPLPGAVTVVTKYRVLETKGDISKLEVELLTGKTHQIRAHLASIGHPIIGDGKYGINNINRKYAKKHQALFAYRIVFNFSDCGILNYLNGKEITINNLPF